MTSKASPARPAGVTRAKGKEAMARLRDAGHKRFSRRSEVIDVFFGAGASLTAPELWDRVRAGGQKVSLATVQLTLNKLVDHGLATVHRAAGEKARFGPTLSESDVGRFICRICRTVTPVVEERVEQLVHAIARAREFETESHRLEIHGVCKDCQSREPGFERSP